MCGGETKDDPKLFMVKRSAVRGHNDHFDRLIPTRVDAQHFGGDKIITAAADPKVHQSHMHWPRGH